MLAEHVQDDSEDEQETMLARKSTEGLRHELDYFYQGLLYGRV